jgi:hypothetical protein
LDRNFYFDLRWIDPVEPVEDERNRRLKIIFRKINLVFGLDGAKRADRQNQSGRPSEKLINRV